VSITEKLTFASNGFVSELKGELNWEEQLLAGEQMTGPIELFGGQVYFGSFLAGGGTATDACPFGGSRIFGLGYLDAAALLEDGSGTATTVLDSGDIAELENALLVGLQVTQVQVCTSTQDDTPVTDPFGLVGTIPMPTASSGRQFRLTGHLSGSATTSGGLSINTLDESITAPDGFTVISGMADTLE
jgi:hypothetical protein